MKIVRLRTALFVTLCLGGALRAEQTQLKDFPILSSPRAVTTGPHDHFLANYFGINAWSPDNRYLLALETDIKNTLPDGRPCTLGLVDTRENNRFIPVTTTRCWNFQEAAMAHWLANEPDTFVFNDLREGKFCAVVLNWRTKKERVYPFPVSAVSEDGTWAVSINYARLYLTRPDYGYAGEGQDPRRGVVFPEDDGLWRVDLRTGEARLIVPTAAVKDQVPFVAKNGLSYLCHTVISKDGQRIYFLSRSVEQSMDGVKKSTGTNWKTTAFTCRADGTEIRRCFPDGWGSSHFNWKPNLSERDARTMIVTCNWQNKVYSHVEFTVGEENAARQVGGPAMNFDGHAIYSPDGQFISGDGYWDESFNRHWKMVRLKDDQVKDVGTFFVPEAYRDVFCRCDLHPRWRPDGRQLAFNSVHEGSRQVYLMDVDDPCETTRVYLSGRGADDAVAWDFTIDKGPHAGEQTTIPVPSCWEMQGFGLLQYGWSIRGAAHKRGDEEPFAATAVYRHRFPAPAKSIGRHVDLCFEAVFTDCRVALNGHVLGEHQGGFYPFQFDVTPFIQATNELVVTVHNESSDPTINHAERRGDFWVYGGIWRPVYLEVKPRRHIRSVAVDARADGSLTAKLSISDGTTQIVREQWERPLLWTAETPNLYTKVFELTNAAGEVEHRLAKRIGFRTIEARRGEGLSINGKRVTIRGVNRHAFRPSTGRTLSPALNREDVELIKSLNMNAVRSSHYPPDPEFLDLCDELGLYVIDELCGWQKAVGTEVGAPLVEAFVTRDQAHPSIIWWANGNEGGFNLALDHLYGDLDLQARPVLHPWSEFGAFNTRHYPRYEAARKLLAGDWIFMPTEFLHGLYDGGHGAGLGEMWRMMMSSPRTAGGFLWDLRDQGVLRPDGTYDCYGTFSSDGIVGPNGELGGSVSAIREIWSPVGLTVKDSSILTVTNRFDFLNLADCAFDWESLSFANDRETVLARGSLSDVAAAPRAAATVALPAAAWEGEALRVTARRRLGEKIFTRVFPRSGFRPSAPKGKSKSQSVPYLPRLVAFKGNENILQQFQPVAADFSWTASTNEDGSVDFAWTIQTTNEVDLLGVTFDLDESQVVSKKWLGRGPSRIWRNRPEGPQFGLWENLYNDGFAGEAWNFPDFKGFFGDVRWLELKLRDGSTVRFELLAPASGVGVFAPKDGRKAYLFELPPLGISILDVYPAIGNKCAPPSAVSPSGQSVRVPGSVSGRVRLSVCR